MMNSIDLANYDGPLRCYVVRSEGDWINGTVTLFFKFGDTNDLDSPCLKLRFRRSQYDRLTETLILSPEYPGVDLGSHPAILDTAAPGWPDVDTVGPDRGS